MTKQVRIWQLIDNSLQQQIPVLLLYVLASEGSSPGRQGFFMAVNAVGGTEGSIGGGIMEHKFVEMAKERLQREEQAVSIKQQYHNKSAAVNQSGMICSGEQTILLYKLQAQDKTTIEAVIASLQRNENGTLQLSPASLSFSPEVPEADHFFSMQSESDWLYREKTGYKNHLYIIGAGHCSLALSRMMWQMDFFIHVFDTRADLPYEHAAHDIQVISSYEELNTLVPAGKNIYVVVMTVGYRTDDIAIRALWDKEFKYFGVLGSSSKMVKMFDDYRAEGMAEEKLSRIHAPVGLGIYSQTPEEIAVSIAAEIISVKNGPPSP